MRWPDQKPSYNPDPVTQVPHLPTYFPTLPSGVPVITTPTPTTTTTTAQELGPPAPEPQHNQPDVSPPTGYGAPVAPVVVSDDIDNLPVIIDIYSNSNDEDDDGYANPEPSTTGDGWIPMPLSKVMEMFTWPQRDVSNSLPINPFTSNQLTTSSPPFQFHPPITTRRPNLDSSRPIRFTTGFPKQNDYSSNNVIDFGSNEDIVTAPDIKTHPVKTVTKVKTAVIQVADIDGVNAPVLVNTPDPPKDKEMQMLEEDLEIEDPANALPRPVSANVPQLVEDLEAPFTTTSSPTPTTIDSTTTEGGEDALDGGNEDKKTTATFVGTTVIQLPQRNDSESESSPQALRSGKTLTSKAIRIDNDLQTQSEPPTTTSQSPPPSTLNAFVSLELLKDHVNDVTEPAFVYDYFDPDFLVDKEGPNEGFVKDYTWTEQIPVDLYDNPDYFVTDSPIRHVSPEELEQLLTEWRLSKLIIRIIFSTHVPLF